MRRAEAPSEKIECESNKEWIGGACRCRSPLRWNGRRCTAYELKKCPADSVGKYPDCRCKRGTTGAPGNCKRIVEPPKECPRGFTGKPPNCKRIGADLPKQCRKGFIGRPPNCRPIIVPRPCPTGMSGVVPNCRPGRG